MKSSLFRQFSKFQKINCCLNIVFGKCAFRAYVPFVFCLFLKISVQPFFKTTDCYTPVSIPLARGGWGSEGEIKYTSYSNTKNHDINTYNCRVQIRHKSYNNYIRSCINQIKRCNNHIQII